MIIPLALALAPVRPTLSLGETADGRLDAAMFDKALDNLLNINTIKFDISKFNGSGLLADTDSWFIRAGGGYPEPWTRDASINSWNAASLLEPRAARTTLLAVLTKDRQGNVIVQPDNQWWDKVIWTVSAWNHFKTTGDFAFLKLAYGVSKRLLAAMKSEHYDAKLHLFKGPSFFNDGIAGYPSPPGPATDTGSTFVLSHPGMDQVMCLSTNCLYAAAYRAASEMATHLHEPADEIQEYQHAADALSTSIARQFWMPKKGTFGYLIYRNDKGIPVLSDAQEGAGISFAILFGIASPGQTKPILKPVHMEKYGLTDTFPCWNRYSASHPGRHNVLVWPMVQGMWGRAMAKIHSVAALDAQLQDLAHLASRSEGNFYEIYNGKDASVEGGWQSGIHFSSQPDQTWSATAYLSMVFNGVFGLRFDPRGLRFSPTVPKAWDGAVLSGIHWRGADLSVQIQGAGVRLKQVLMDGKAVKGGEVSDRITGSHRITLRVD